MNKNENVFESLTNLVDGQSLNVLFRKPLKQALHSSLMIGMGPKCGK